MMAFPILAESTQFGNILMAAGVMLLAVVMLISVRRRWRRSEKLAEAARLDPNERLERSKQISGMKGDLRTMMVELEELTRRFSAQLDAKSLKLEKLIREADQRISSLSPRERPAEGFPLPLPRGEGRGEGSQNHGAPSRELASSSPVEVHPDPLARNVYELADSGNDAEQIARRLGEHVGKVELILALRQH